MKKTVSLKKNIDFRSVYKKGKSLADKYLVMYILENGSQSNRLGISVSKKVGNSVIRHHITRLVRESYRVNEDRFCTGYDIVFIARIRANDADYHDIQKSVLKLSGLHGIERIPQ
ncbi:MAG: ribonuclease P protein component [Lachnospiraceae bacterium]|nr:ribonuclease P protein component [Lachnospiraceae bacterium]